MYLDDSKKLFIFFSSCLGVIFIQLICKTMQTLIF